MKKSDEYSKKTMTKFKKVIADIIKNIGYTAIAKQIPKMSTNKLEKNVMWILNKEIAIGKGCEYLTHPITRKKTKNPMRPKYIKARLMIKEAIKRLKELEKKVNK